MDWAVIIHLLTEAPNNVHAQSHYVTGFGSEKLCMDAVKAFNERFSVVTESGTKISVRAVCVPKK